jgi:hypothetical protein
MGRGSQLARHLKTPWLRRSLILKARSSCWLLTKTMVRLTLLPLLATHKQVLHLDKDVWDEESEYIEMLAKEVRTITFITQAVVYTGRLGCPPPCQV